MDNRYEIAEQNGMSREFADWFFDNKKAGCGNVWFMMMAAMWEGWQGCDAMLQGAEPVTTAYKLPDDFDFDRFNDVVWLEAVASNPHMHSLTTSTIAMVALELNKRLETGNSPVIPDGWVMVPVEPTMEMLDEFDSIIDHGAEDSKEAWSRLIAAAPQQEVKS
ncbi:hypothetical protein BWZ29_02460 [Enterobacter cancerogenus]|nr:hypothetical protein BWZ29_02460 [Enterobacter cancerogenus]